MLFGIYSFYISGMILISYLIYSFISKEFLAFTLSKNYWMSLFLGAFLGIFLGVFLDAFLREFLLSVRIGIVENEAFFEILFDLIGDIMAGIILGIIFGSIFGIIFGIIFGAIKEYNRNLTRIEIKSTRKLFFINLHFMMFSSMFLIFSLGGSVGAQLMLITLVGFLKGW